MNWGIIGLGKIAKKFATDIKVVANARLHAVASRSIAKATDFATQFDVPHAFGTYEDLLHCPDLDAIYIATPHVFHYANTMMCLEAGFPVLCEKPFAMNYQQVQQMVNKASEKDVFLMEAMWTSCLPTLLKTKALIADGTLGELLSIRADFGFNAPRKFDNRIYNKALGGGALLDIGIYPVFLALHLFGYPNEIWAAAKIGQTGVDEEIGIIFQYESGKMAHLHSTILTQTTTEAFIYGTKGTLHLHERWFAPTYMSLHTLDNEAAQAINFKYQSGGFEYEIAEATQCLLDGKKQSDLMPLKESLALMQLLDNIRAKIGLNYPESSMAI
ncbi:MAG: Gfo/Idh/MocA family oxidoreductase [Saprospiraceae bacterium]|nr:Gfo/Idh/MocA family oxidoreductase [Saprospiraceae bacterium]